MDEVALKMTNINKSFGGVQVLYDVNFDVRAGEVHALLGENGAGKSVLMKTLMGVHRPDSGDYLIAGKNVRFNNPTEAQRNRVSMVYQEFGLVKYLTVAENIFMGRLPSRRGMIRWGYTRKRASEVLGSLGSSVPPSAVVGDLKVADQQEVEIARALSYDPVVFIMDEPSAALSYDEIGHLYELVNTLREKGVAIVYITHKLNEVFDIADRCTVIRDGRIEGTYAISELDLSMLVEKMTGKKVSAEVVREDTYKKPKESIIELHGMNAKEKDKVLYTDVDMKVGKGEIVGIAGQIGAGKTELGKTIFGALPKTFTITGEMLFDGEPVNMKKLSPSVAKKMGIGFVTEDRQAEGIIAEQSVLFNLILPAFQRVTRGFVIIGGMARDLVRGIIKDVALRPPEPGRLVKFLSGGNQQKVVIGKWLAAESRLLILDEPTRGVDVGAREEIYEVVRQQVRENGLGVILLSSDLREIMIAADRILVMRLGRITHEVLPHETSERQLLHFVLGEEEEAEGKKSKK
ncbi:MAG: sugar ABC transporter ATP-binding protein [Dehalococcoidales bacterium]|nr:sugar ABC transporter ATP-binding protein [Dehalococcoidales bacterium]